MTTYPLDIDAGQLVHWLLDAERRHEEGLSVRASREYVFRPVGRSARQRIGDEEAEDLSEVTAVGLLEVTPPPDHDGWVIRVRIEDELGGRVPDDESVQPGEEAIDIEAFEADFVKPDRGTVDISAEVDSGGALRRLNRLVAKVREDRHARGRGGAKS